MLGEVNSKEYLSRRTFNPARGGDEVNDDDDEVNDDDDDISDDDDVSQDDANAGDDKAEDSIKKYVFHSYLTLIPSILLPLCDSLIVLITYSSTSF